MNNPEQHTKRKKGFRKISPFLLIRLIGILLFIFILTTVDFHSLWSDIKGVNLEYLAYGIIFQVVLLFLKAARWHILNSGSKKTALIIRSFGEFFESYSIGVITPGRLGELVKVGHAKERNRIIETGLRVLVERGFDVGIFIILAGLAMSLIFKDRVAWVVILLVILAGILVLAVAVALMRSAKATKIVQLIMNKIPLLKHNVDLMFRKRSIMVQLSVVLLSLASNFSTFISCYFLALGLSFDHGFIFISGAVATAGLLNMLPVTIMGLGTREATFLVMFRPLAESLILAFSGLVFLVAQIGGGLISLVLGQLFLSMPGGKRKGK